MKNKIISGVLVSALALSMCPMNVFAETDNITEPNSSTTEQNTELKDSVIEIKDTTITATYGDGVKTFTYTSTPGITPIVSSSDTSVATVKDINGVVTLTILKAGTSRIEVKFDGNEEYKPSSDYIDLVVEKADTKLGIVADIQDIVGGGVVKLKTSGVPSGVVAKVECNDTKVTVTKQEDGSYAAILPDVTKAYKFILSIETNDYYEVNNTFCTVYVTSLEDSFVENVTVGEAELKAAIVSDTVILDTLTAQKLEEIIDENKIEDVLSFDFTTAFEEVDIIRLDNESIKSINRILTSKFFDVDYVEFILNTGKIKFDINAWGEVLKNVSTTGTTFSLTTHKVKELNNRQQKALSDHKVETVVDFTVIGKQFLTEIDGEVTVSVDYNKGKSYDVYSITNRGHLEEYKSTMKDGYIVFNTDRCLDYVIVQSSDSTVKDETPTTNYDKNKVMILTINSKVMQIYGQTQIYDVAPIIKNSRTMLPIRVIAENLGGHVEWDGRLRKVTIEKDNTFIELFIDSAFAKVNGKVVILDSPAFISENRTYLPVRFIAENLGAEVLWNDTNRDVVIIPKN